MSKLALSTKHTAPQQVPSPAESDLQRITAHCLEFCERRRLAPVILALPFIAGPAQQQLLLQDPRVKGLIARNGYEAGGAVGEFAADAYRWEMPAQSARTIALIGPRAHLSFHMVLAAFRHGIAWLVYATPLSYRRERVAAFLLGRFYEKAAYLIGQRLRAAGSILAQAVRRLPKGAESLERLHAALSPLLSYRMVRRFERTLAGAESPLLARTCFVPGRVVLINTSLTHGGAERQVTNTVLGLMQRGVRDVTLLCDAIHSRPEHDFYFWQLQGSGAEVAEIRMLTGLTGRDELKLMAARIERALKPLSRTLADEILCYVCELVLRRPEVVHLWQDATNIKGGIAAALVGVPRIVLSTRNMTPNRFHYHLPYMRPGYRALARRENVVLANNSRAGAEDYARWLDLPRERFRVVYNGIEPDALQPPPAADLNAYRESLGLPPGAPVVGSMFRFYPEKDPMLWVEVAGRVAEAHPSVHFLLIGAGPLLETMRTRAAGLGIAGRLLTPGTVKNPALPLSLMDVFLLTSKLEGTPNVVIEAQWLGVPVVATDAGGTRDAVDCGRSGWIVASRDPGALTERVLYVLDHRDRDVDARRASRTFAARRFGMASMIDATLQLYGYVAECRSVP